MEDIDDIYAQRREKRREMARKTPRGDHGRYISLHPQKEKKPVDLRKQKISKYYTQFIPRDEDGFFKKLFVPIPGLVSVTCMVNGKRYVERTMNIRRAKSRLRSGVRNKTIEIPMIIADIERYGVMKQDIELWKIATVMEVPQIRDESDENHWKRLRYLQFEYLATLEDHYNTLAPNLSSPRIYGAGSIENIGVDKYRKQLYELDVNTVAVIECVATKNTYVFAAQKAEQRYKKILTDLNTGKYFSARDEKARAIQKDWKLYGSKNFVVYCAPIAQHSVFTAKKMVLRSLQQFHHRKR